MTLDSTMENKLLVIDDEPGNMMVVVKSFQDSFKVLYANNGKRGYNIAVEEVPDIIIMDWEMPVLNGIDTIMMLKATEVTCEIPIIMSTGIMTSAKHLKKALEAGAVDFINKPFDKLELVARTQAALRLSQSNKRIKELMANEQVMLKQQLSQKERELTRQAIQAEEQSQLIIDITKKIDSLKNKLDGKEIKALADIKKSLQNLVDENKSWDNFLMHFESVHPLFFKCLKERFPAITNNDMRLSAYIKIGMDNKEMAQIAGVSLGTIKSNLNRLKKKLNLTPEDSIRQFIIEFASNEELSVKIPNHRVAEACEVQTQY